MTSQYGSGLKVLVMSMLISLALGVTVSSGEDTAKKDEAKKTEEAKTPEASAKTDEKGAAEVPAAIAEAKTEAPKKVSAIRDSSNATLCIVDQDAIEDIQKRKAELDSKGKELAAKEMELRAKEKALEDELGKLQEIRDEIAKIEDLQKKGSEEKVNKLVETFETMSPKNAAQVIATIDESLAVAAMQKMSTQKLAKVMNVMETQKSSRLSEMLAGVVRARMNRTASRGAAETTSSHTKGGENKDANANNNTGDNTANNVGREPAGSKESKKPNG